MIIKMSKKFTRPANLFDFFKLLCYITYINKFNFMTDVTDLSQGNTKPVVLRLMDETELSKYNANPVVLTDEIKEIDLTHKVDLFHDDTNPVVLQQRIYINKSVNKFNSMIDEIDLFQDNTNPDILRERIYKIPVPTEEQIDSVFNLIKNQDVIKKDGADFFKERNTFQDFLFGIYNNNFDKDKINISKKDVENIKKFIDIIEQRSIVLHLILSIPLDSVDKKLNDRKELKKLFDQQVESNSLELSNILKGSVRGTINGILISDRTDEEKLQILQRMRKNISLLDEVITNRYGKIDMKYSSIDEEKEDKNYKPISPYLIIPDFNATPLYSNVPNASTQLNFTTEFFEILEKIKKLVENKNRDDYDQICFLSRDLDRILDDDFVQTTLFSNNPHNLVILRQLADKSKECIVKNTGLNEEQIKIRIIRYEIKQLDNNIESLNETIKKLTMMIGNEQDQAKKDKIQKKINDALELKTKIEEEKGEKRKTITKIENQKRPPRLTLTTTEKLFVKKELKKTIKSNKLSQTQVIPQTTSDLQHTLALLRKTTNEIHSEVIKQMNKKNAESDTKLNQNRPAQKSSLLQSFGRSTSNSHKTDNQRTLFPIN
ncbi:MAG: hypothetical protein Ta2D_11980 [Rickettsiales bacterium]|nr:MAG: hypothetical protein Ta2D_11980 [Rickettsiales bacterium]